MGLFGSRNERKFKKADTARRKAVSTAGRDLQKGKSSGGKVLSEHKKSVKNNTN